MTPLLSDRAASRLAQRAGVIVAGRTRSSRAILYYPSNGSAVSFSRQSRRFQSSGRGKIPAIPQMARPAGQSFRAFLEFLPDREDRYRANTRRRGKQTARRLPLQPPGERLSVSRRSQSRIRACRLRTRRGIVFAAVSINSLGRFSGGEYDVLRPSALRTEVCAEDGAS